MYEYKATVVKFVDGDTVDMNVDLGFNISTLVRFRITGLDTPERTEEGFKDATKIASEVMPIGTTHIVKTRKKDKYGRWLVDLPIVKEALNEANLNKLK